MKHPVVIDTNVILLAFQSKFGKSFELISKTGRGLFEVAISVPLILDYSESMPDGNPDLIISA